MELGPETSPITPLVGSSGRTLKTSTKGSIGAPKSSRWLIVFGAESSRHHRIPWRHERQPVNDLSVSTCGDGPAIARFWAER